MCSSYLPITKYSGFALMFQCVADPTIVIFMSIIYFYAPRAITRSIYLSVMAFDIEVISFWYLYSPVTQKYREKNKTNILRDLSFLNFMVYIDPLRIYIIVKHHTIRRWGSKRQTIKRDTLLFVYISQTMHCLQTLWDIIYTNYLFIDELGHSFQYNFTFYQNI